MTPLETYLEMLTFTRPAWSVYEEAFITRYIEPLNPDEDPFGNLYVDIGEDPNIIWSSHTDTVHYNSGFQELRFNPSKSMVWSKGKDCLGADCTTGVWLMIEMIKAKRPGRYIFHRAEEIGCQGSTYIRDKMPEMLKGIDAAIAFDRMNTNEVLTHQGYRTASDKFAESVCAQLPGYRPSTNGFVTDTKMYAGKISECTNISVGYFNQHTKREKQDLTHLLKLRDWMLAFDTTKLTFERTPEIPVAKTWGYQGARRYLPDESVSALVWDHPVQVAKVLERCGFDYQTLKGAIEDTRAAEGHVLQITSAA